MKKEFRLYLRDLRPEDADVSFHWRQNDDIWKNLFGPRYYVSQAYEQHWVQNAMVHSGHQKIQAICLKEGDQLLGYVYLAHLDLENGCASSGKLIGSPGDWSKGYGAEATLLLLYDGFVNLGLERVESQQIIWNVAARRSVEKLGYQWEGVLRRAVYKDGAYHDVTVLGLQREGFLPWLDVYRFPGESEVESERKEGDRV